MADDTGFVQTCPLDERPVDEHTVAEWKQCLSTMHDHDLPYEDVPDGPVDQSFEGFLAGAVTIKAGVSASDVGVFPVLVFGFSGPDGALPPVSLVMDENHMRSLRTLVSNAIDGARHAARKTRKRRGGS